MYSFYVAVEGEEILSIVGCVAKKPPPIYPDKKILVKELGFFRGRIAFWGVNKFIINHKYPFEIQPGTGIIEFVAASAAHTRKGATYGLMQHVLNVTRYSAYVLEVMDINAAAIALYSKLGFSEFVRKPAPKAAMFNEYVYMRKQSDSKAESED